MTVLGVVPGQESPAPGAGVLVAAEALRIARHVLQRLELRVGEGVVIGHVWARERALHTQVDVELGQGLEKWTPNFGRELNGDIRLSKSRHGDLLGVHTIRAASVQRRVPAPAGLEAGIELSLPGVRR